MKREDFPSKDAAFDTLALLFPILYRGYEDAIQQACQYFVTQSRDINRYLFPCLVREALILHLSAKEFPIEFILEPLSGNGLCIRYNGYVLRFRMTFEGELPVPGRSKTLQAHYQQEIAWERPTICQLELPFTFEEEEYNVVVLWHMSRRYVFEQLLLAAPKDGDETSVDVHWIEPIPYLGRRSIETGTGVADTDAEATDDFIALDTGETVNIDGGEVELGDGDESEERGSGQGDD